MNSIMFEKLKSIPKIIKLIISAATITIMALDCNSGQVGHVTLNMSSLYASFM